VSAGSAYGLRPTLAWPVTWPAPLKSRYVTWGALQVLYAFAFAANFISNYPVFASHSE